ncbi:MAG: TldD/PmbA family protein [Candidatus Heimdallarchaeota archaeon]|nr:TldD/PmbA family protein [Candidatus Heimdallarchaeota archaeon]
MELGERAIKKALELGMDEAEAYINKIKNVNFQFATEIQNIKTTESIGIGLRVAKGKKLAMQATSILNEKEIDSIVEKAVKIANVAPEDQHWNHFNKIFGKSEVTGTYDKTFDSLDYDKISEIILSSIDKATEEDRKVLVTRGVFTYTIGSSYVVNNYNKGVEDKYTVTSGSINCKAIEGGESSGSEGHICRKLSDLKLEDLSVKAAEKALKYLGAKPFESTKMPVIMKNDLFSNILGIMLGYNINAENIQKGRSTFATKMDQQIASEDISVIDDGTMKDGVFTRSFDTDGTPTQKTKIISKGILKNILYDNYTALKGNTKSTGNANRNYWNTPNPTTNNLILQPGSTSLEDMIKDTKKGLFIENTIGEWLSRPTSGDLNATVTHGFLIENGELTKPVTNVVIGGNMFDILLNKIEVLGNDLHNSFKVYSPSVKISEMTIAGK